MKQLQDEQFFKQGSNNVLQVKLFLDRDKVSDITQDCFYQAKSIINRYDKNDNKSRIIIQ